MVGANPVPQPKESGTRDTAPSAHVEAYRKVMPTCAYGSAAELNKSVVASTDVRKRHRRMGIVQQSFTRECE